MNTKSTANYIRTISRLYPSFFALAGGLRIYEIDAATGARWPSVPAHVVGTLVLFFALDATNEILIRAKSASAIAGDTTLEVELENNGDALLLLATSTGWEPINLSTVQVS